MIILFVPVRTSRHFFKIISKNLNYAWVFFSKLRIGDIQVLTKDLTLVSVNSKTKILFSIL